mmetsp:Transcript_384/g.901  ORF Transcript_384/g.901 Transcript_384/m.901 type:complete len:234 (-) Transcript_384:82-783(-)
MFVAGFRELSVQLIELHAFLPEGRLQLLLTRQGTQRVVAVVHSIIISRVLVADRGGRTAARLLELQVLLLVLLVLLGCRSLLRMLLQKCDEQRGGRRGLCTFQTKCLPQVDSLEAFGTRDGGFRFKHTQSRLQPQGLQDVPHQPSDHLAVATVVKLLSKHVGYCLCGVLARQAVEDLRFVLGLENAQDVVPLQPLEHIVLFVVSGSCGASARHCCTYRGKDDEALFAHSLSVF